MYGYGRILRRQCPGVYPSGQRGRAVNPLAFAYAGSNPAAPILTLSVLSYGFALSRKCSRSRVGCFFACRHRQHNRIVRRPFVSRVILAIALPAFPSLLNRPQFQPQRPGNPRDALARQIAILSQIRLNRTHRHTRWASHRSANWRIVSMIGCN